MPDLREIAQSAHDDWLLDRPLDYAMSRIRAALDSPDPVAEAREIIRLLPEAFDAAAHWIEACPFENAIPHAVRLRSLESQAREWLKRNGG